MSPSLKIIITGATGMVGEGVLLACLQHADVSQILMLNRKPFALQHPKLTELLLPDFMNIATCAGQLKGYDACFYCAGISSVGMKEEVYTKITYDTTLQVAQLLSSVNPNMVFDFVSGQLTDNTEQGRMMWARVKGRTENALMKLPFRGQYNFRPGFMKPYPGQKNVKALFRFFEWFYPVLFPGRLLTLEEVAHAMIHTVTRGYDKQVLEISDIRSLSK